MPLFFIISGLTKRQHTDIRSFRQSFFYLLKKRFYSYLFPYIVWGLFYSALTLTNLIKLLYGTRELLVNINSLSSLWFLPVLFIADIISECIIVITQKLEHRKIAICLLMIGLFLSGFTVPHLQPYGWPFGMDIGLVASGFILLGYQLKNILTITYISLKKGKKNLPLILTFCISVLIFAVINRFRIIKVEMFRNYYDVFYLFIIYSLTGIFVMIALTFCAERFLPKKLQYILEFIGRNTLGILVLHKPIVNYLNRLSELFCIRSNITSTLLVTPIGLFFSLGITLLISKISPCLLGKSNDSSKST